MSLSSPFITRPVTTTLLNISVVLAGAVCFSLLPVSPLPQIDFPVIFVSANLPGASPETMASTVATPLERALGNTGSFSLLNVHLDPLDKSPALERLARRLASRVRPTAEGS